VGMGVEAEVVRMGSVRHDVISATLSCMLGLVVLSRHLY